MYYSYILLEIQNFFQNEKRKWRKTYPDIPVRFVENHFTQLRQRYSFQEIGIQLVEVRFYAHSFHDEVLRKPWIEFRLNGLFQI